MQHGVAGLLSNKVSILWTEAEIFKNKKQPTANIATRNDNEISRKDNKVIKKVKTGATI